MSNWTLSDNGETRYYTVADMKDAIADCKVAAIDNKFRWFADRNANVVGVDVNAPQWLLGALELNTLTREEPQQVECDTWWPCEE
jgi:hypothetical protein